MAESNDPRFVCDAMLGGLARWLRAAGYDASWRVDIGDRELIELAQREGRIILTSDSDIHEYGLVRDGEVPALFVPRGQTIEEQLVYVLQTLDLPVREQRCMACGGALARIGKEAARTRVPARSWEWAEEFYECLGCGRLYWPGTHWRRIAAVLDRVRRDREA